ncbi:MAG TPA: hypothetical protein VFF69_16060 [Phycisphaerales bacterium]|nr:hypothetical protein [Phycisphaerales bacterium]
MNARIALIFALILVSVAAPALAQSTAFTYQGRLISGGVPASGLHDFRFKLFDAPSGGNQVGTTLCAENVAVTEGFFVSTLDFGQQFATPTPRFLEILVRSDAGAPCTDDFGYVLLSPRQPLTAAPLAGHARSAFALDASDGTPLGAVDVDADGDVGIGTSAPATRLDVRGGPISVENIGDQADLLWLNTERSWVFRQEGTGPTTALKLESVGGGGNKSFIFDTDGLVGIGTTSPLAKLDVRGDIRLGPSGEFQTATAGKNLRIIRGVVDPRDCGDAAFSLGSGYTVQELSCGELRITFDTPFAGTAVVVGSSEWDSGFGGKYVTCSNVTSSKADIRVFNSAGNNVRWPFSFMAVGPR